MDKTFLTAKDLVNLIGVSCSYAYRIITELNKELEELGHRTIKGKVNAKYFEERYFYTAKN